MAHCKEKKLQKQRSRDAPVKPQGKQTVKQLIGQNQGVSNIEITDPSIKEFEKIARKYGVDYAVKKDRSTSPPKYLIFFKARDADALTAAFTEYTGKKVKKAEKTERPSVLAKLNQFKELVKNAVVDRTRRKELETHSGQNYCARVQPQKYRQDHTRTCRNYRNQKSQPRYRRLAAGRLYDLYYT